LFRYNGGSKASEVETRVQILHFMTKLVCSPNWVWP